MACRFDFHSNVGIISLTSHLNPLVVRWVLSSHVCNVCLSIYVYVFHHPIHGTYMHPSNPILIHASPKQNDRKATKQASKHKLHTNPILTNEPNPNSNTIYNQSPNQKQVKPLTRPQQFH